MGISAIVGRYEPSPVARPEGEVQVAVDQYGNLKTAGLPAALTTLGNFKVAVNESGLGFSSTQTFTPAAAAYGAADIMDVCKAFTFANAVSAAMPTGSLFRILTATIKIDVTSVPSGQTSYTLHLYSVTQPSAQADNDAWTLASGDLASYLGSISLGTPADKGAALHNKQQYVDYDVRFAGTTIFGVLVTDGAHTAAAVARSVSLHGVVL